MINQDALEQVVRTVSRLLENGIPENIIYNKLLTRGCAEYEATEVLRLAKGGSSAPVATATAPPPPHAEYQGMYVSDAPPIHEEPPQPIPMTNPPDDDESLAAEEELSLRSIEDEEYPYKADTADQEAGLEPKTPIEWRKVYVVLLFLAGAVLAAGVVTLIAWLAFRTL